MERRTDIVIEITIAGVRRTEAIRGISSRRLLVILFAAILMLSCRPSAATTATPTPTPTQTPTATTTTTSAVYSAPELKYRLMSGYGEVFYCDPDFYPVGREGQEEKNASEQFATIRADRAEFSAILVHLRLPDKTEYDKAETLNIYREHKKLKLGVELVPSSNEYEYTLRIGQGQGSRIQGNVTPGGSIRETKRETSFNTCPICLARGTLIDTPHGPVPVEQLREGMTVWTVDGSRKLAGVVLRTSSTPVPSSMEVVTLGLADGRSVTASPGHPDADGRALGDLAPGETLDGAIILSSQRVKYDSDRTYDILPSGNTGLYWANGILLKSTLGP